MEVVVTAGVISRANLQLNRHHQQTNTQLFTGRMPFLLSPNHQCQITEGNVSVGRQWERNKGAGVHLCIWPALHQRWVAREPPTPAPTWRAPIQFSAGRRRIHVCVQSRHKWHRSCCRVLGWVHQRQVKSASWCFHTITWQASERVGFDVPAFKLCHQHNTGTI